MISTKNVIIAAIVILAVSLTSFGIYWEFFEYQSGYRLEGPMRFDGNKLEGYLNYRGLAKYYRRLSSPLYRNLSFTAKFESDNELSIVITDPANTRFALPYKAPFPFSKAKGVVESPLYDVQYESDKFSFKVLRKSTKEVIFDTKDHNLVFSDKYIEFGTNLPTKYLYGLGERRRKFLYDPGTYTIWPKDQVAINTEGKPGNETYSQHPFYLSHEKSGNFHTVFFRSTNAMDVLFDGESLKYNVVGGRIELKFFLGNILFLIK
jgi:alpha-glucosidase